MSTELADAEDLDIGDVVPVAFWWACDLTGLCEYDEVVEPIGVEHLQVVGIGTLADEVLPDGLYPRGRMIVSPDVAERYDCVGPEPRGISAARPPSWCFPPIVRGSYQYFSLDLADGVNGIPAALAAFDAATRAANDRWADEYGEEAPEYFLVPTANPHEQARIERATRPTVAALAVLGAATAALTIALIVLATAEAETKPTRSAAVVATRPDGARAGWLVATPMLAAVGIGVAITLAVAWLVSPLAPAGEVRTVDPSPSRELTGPVVVAGIGLAIVMAAAVGLLAWRAARVSIIRAETVSSRLLRRVPRWVETAGSPAVVDGVRAAARHAPPCSRRVRRSVSRSS